jgi:peptide-methionine (S)-S-oxide reductase
MPEMFERLFRMAHASEFVHRDFPDPARDLPATPGPRDAVLAGGCFWCTEAVYRQIDGVLDVISGYAGGAAETATYEAVCTGRTGHAEAIRITYDPSRVSYGMLLKVFFATAHDPTQLNRQGNDVGTQYRSAIFWADAAEQAVAEAYIAQLDAAKVFPAPIVTTLEPLKAFFPAEPYHQDYAARNPRQPYIAAVSAPKVAKTREMFAGLLKAAPAK